MFSFIKYLDFDSGFSGSDDVDKVAIDGGGIDVDISPNIWQEWF